MLPISNMLHEFLNVNRDELVRRCRAKVVKRTGDGRTSPELLRGIPLFLDELIRTLLAEQGPRAVGVGMADVPSASAERHGNELLRQGFSVDQVVHDYGDLCQAVTELAAEQDAAVTVDEFRTLNRCLDDAIADAVTEFGRERDQRISAEGTQHVNDRMTSLTHELRNLLTAATLAFDAIKSGSVAVTGATGAVLDRSLIGMRDIINRKLAEDPR